MKKKTDLQSYWEKRSKKEMYWLSVGQNPTGTKPH